MCQCLIFVFYGAHNGSFGFGVVAKPGANSTRIAQSFLIAIISVKQPVPFRMIGMEATFAQETVTSVFQYSKISGVTSYRATGTIKGDVAAGIIRVSIRIGGVIADTVFSDVFPCIQGHIA
ncbi:hypothetical protein SDC9_180409 [bioreactor metagenome]|uniref:Uncharacterized protein n=1 Tax=bioreactor metagenome TaxID=1076179 RepID=A0A645H362_9ZZZZ